MQLTSIDSDIPKNLQEIIRFLKENEIVNISSLKQQIEEFKKLQILKDNEISKLNDIILSRKNEIDKYQKIIEEQKKGTRESQIEEEYKNEKEKLIGRVNDLEIKIYNLNDEKNTMAKENAKLQSQIDELFQEKEKVNKKINEEKKENNEKTEKSNSKYESLMK